MLMWFEKKERNNNHNYHNKRNTYTILFAPQIRLKTNFSSGKRDPLLIKKHNPKPN